MTTDYIQLSEATLWWPHTHGDPYLYKVEFSFNYGSDSNVVAVMLQHGVRTIKPYIDKRTQGWAFEINDTPVYLIGGNWIATDQLLR